MHKPIDKIKSNSITIIWPNRNIEFAHCVKSTNEEVLFEVNYIGYKIWELIDMY